MGGERDAVPAPPLTTVLLFGLLRGYILSPLALRVDVYELLPDRRAYRQLLEAVACSPPRFRASTERLSPLSLGSASSAGDGVLTLLTRSRPLH